jgi:hypothetical protein
MTFDKIKTAYIAELKNYFKKQYTRYLKADKFFQSGKINPDKEKYYTAFEKIHKELMKTAEELKKQGVEVELLITEVEDDQICKHGN